MASVKGVVVIYSNVIIYQKFATTLSPKTLKVMDLTGPLRS